MYRSLRFQIALNVMAVVAAISAVIAEYSYDASSAVLGIILTLILIVTAAISFGRSGQKLPVAIRWFLNSVIFICILGFLAVLLLGRHGGFAARAFSMAHFTLVIVSCKFIQAYRTKDYSQILIMSLLLMVVSATTCGSVLLVVPFLAYMLLGGYCLILYQLQQQVDIVCASRFVGITPTPDDLDRLAGTTRKYWTSLGHVRFSLACLVMLTFASLLAIVVFFVFPRLESGSLFGGRFNSSSVSGFSDRIELGGIDKNQALRQVVARMSIDSGNESKILTGYNRPIYLRCLSFDIYRQIDNEDGNSEWQRSYLGYVFEKTMSTKTNDYSEKTIEQNIVLGQQDSRYVPCIYPVASIEGNSTVSFSANLLDRTVSYRQMQSAAPIEYTARSFLELSDETSFNWFRRQMMLLGPYWSNYSSSVFGISNELHKLAHSIAGDLAERRQELAKIQSAAHSKWQRQYRKEAGSYHWHIFWALHQLQRETNQPNTINKRQLELAGEVYDASLELAKLDRQIAGRVVGYLRKNYTYSTDPPETPEPKIDDDGEYIYIDPIEVFLAKHGNGGNCEYFASATAILCRALGLKVRMAVGYLTDEYVPELDYYIVRQSDAHSWAELYTADRDWMIYEATPAGDEPIRQAERSYLAHLQYRLSNYLEDLQCRWLRFTASGKADESLVWAESIGDWLEGLQTAPAEDDGKGVTQALYRWFTLRDEEPFYCLALRWMIFFFSVINIGIGIREFFAWSIPKFLRWQIFRRNIYIYSQESVTFYRRMLETLNEIEINKPAGQTPREFAMCVMGYDKAFEPVGNLSELYYRVRFGGMSLDEKGCQAVEDALRQLAVIVTSVRKTASRPWPWQE